MKCGSLDWQEVEAIRKDFIIELIHQDEILDFRAPQGHSGRNLSDFSLQNNLVILNNFFEYILHIRMFFNFNSITNSGLIPEGQFERRTDGILYVCGSCEQ